MHDWLLPIYNTLDPLFLIYFTIINLVYTVLFIFGLIGTFKRMHEIHAEDVTNIFKSHSLPEINFIIPTYNDSSCIISCVKNLIDLSYRFKKIIVVNDGSTDNTLDVLSNELQLESIPIFFEPVLPSKTIKGVYRSNLYKNVIVIDKENGQKFDALNAAINACESVYFVIMDSDTFIEDSEFEALIRPIFSSPKTIIIGAAVKLKNGCQMLWNRVQTNSFPQNYVSGIQAVEYLRSFLMRVGWDYIGENYIVSGAFGVFNKNVIVQAGGYGPTIANDLEIILRVRRIMEATDTPYQIVYLPDPVAWTDGPGSWKALADQRARWHRGMLESLWFHKSVLFNPKYGFYGMFTYPFLVFFEAFEPLIEIFGYIYIIVGLIFGIVTPIFILLFLIATIGFVFIQTLFAFIIEEFSFRKYPSFKTIIKLFGYSVIENFGYRQLTLIWRAQGFVDFFKRFHEIKEDSKSMNKFLDQLIKKGKIQW